MENRKINISFLIFYLLTLYPTYYGINLFLISVGYYFSNILEYLGAILIYLTPFIIFCYFVKGRIINKQTRTGKITFLIIIGIIILIGIVLFFLKLDVLIRNYKYHLINIFYPFDLLLIVLGDIFFLIRIAKTINTKEEKIKHSKKFYFVIVLFAFGLIFIEFFMYESLFIFHLLDTLPLRSLIPTLIIEFACILPFVSVYLLFRKDVKKDTKKLKLVLSILSVISILALHIMQIIDPNIFALIGKPYFQMDFYASIVIAPIILTYTAIIPLIGYAVLNKKKN